MSLFSALHVNRKRSPSTHSSIRWCQTRPLSVWCGCRSCIASPTWRTVRRAEEYLAGAQAGKFSFASWSFSHRHHRHTSSKDDPLGPYTLCMSVYICDALIITSRRNTNICAHIELDAVLLCVYLLKMCGGGARYPSTSVLKLMKIYYQLSAMCKISGFTVTSGVCVCVCLCICLRVCVSVSGSSSPPCSVSPGRVLLLPYWEYDGLPLPLPAMS